MNMSKSIYQVGITHIKTVIYSVNRRKTREVKTVFLLFKIQVLRTTNEFIYQLLCCTIRENEVLGTSIVNVS